MRVSWFLDLGAAVLVGIAVVHGGRRGGTRVIVRLAGLILGALIGFLAAGLFVTPAAAPVTHLALDLLIVLGFALLGRGAASALADRLVLRRGAARRAFRTSDGIVGIVVYGVVSAGLCSLVLAGVAVLAPARWASAARDSVAARLLRPAGSAIDSATGRVLAGAPADLRALVPRLPAPPGAGTASTVATAAGRSVVPVDADGCGAGVQGTGFATGDGHLIVTNAHVVRGASHVAIRLADGTSRPARVIAFAPDPDVAVLYASDVTLAPLPLGDDASNGTPGVIVGYPDGVRTVTPASVLVRLPVPGPSWHGFSVHQAYLVDAAVRHGNSGSPLLDLSGHVRGLVNALSTSDPDEGFATTVSELRRVLARTVTTSPVPTGTCAI